tara:strand:+ start:319 stop:1134 length:816 start_codon:yes stop_codon:yes gene_type:complete
MAAHTFKSNLPHGRGGHDPTILLANKFGLVIDIWGMHCQQRATFKAILESYKDEFNTQLESYTFIGNPQPYRKQKTIERSTSIGLTIPAYSISEAKENLDTVGMLVKMLHPTATSRGRVGGSSESFLIPVGGDPMFKVKFLNLLSDGSKAAGDTADAQSTGVTGYIDNLSYDFVLDSDGGGFLTAEGDEKGYVYPKVIRMSFVFYPFESTVPVWRHSKKDNFTREHFPYGIKAPSLGDQKFKAQVVANASNDSGVNEIDEISIEKALDAFV